MLGCLAVCSGASASFDFLSWLKSNVLERLHVTGSQTFGLHYQSVDGDEQTYRDQWNYGRQNDTFTDNRDVYIAGDKVLGVLTFDVHLSNQRYRRPQDDKVMLSYEKKGVKAELGDISASLLNTNELIGFRRAMRGAQIETKIGGLRIKGVYSDIRSSARTISIQGNNSSGPYYLQAGYIVESSVQVQVDGVPQKLGVDFTMNVDAGTITFENKVIPPSSTIVVTYETMGANSSRGTIMGGGISYDFGKGISVGLTHVIQDPKISQKLVQTTEEFQGYGPPDTPYFLSSIPDRDFPLTVKVDGILQTEGVDYYFDANNPMVFYFTRFMPSNSVIRVTYTPMPDAGTFGSGKRTVSGVDFGWVFGKPTNGGSLKYSLAQSNLETPKGTQIGTAHAVRLDYKTGRFSISGNYKNIPSNFISIEGVGFNRNEIGTTAQIGYNAGKGFKFTLQGSDAKIGTPTFDGNGLKVVTGKTQQLRFRSEWNPTEDRGLFFEVNQQTGEYDGKGSQGTGFTTGYTQKLKRFSYEISALNQTVQSHILNNDGTLNTITGTLSGGQISGAYNFGKGISLSSKLGLMNVKTSQDEGTGHVSTTTLNYQPNSKLDMSLSYVDTFSGAVTGIPGFGTGSGYGFNGNGFSGGGFDFGLNSAQSRAKVLALTTRWTPIDSLSFQAQFAKTDSEGNNLTNSKSDVGIISAMWNPSKRTSVHLDVSQSNTQLLNVSGKSKTTMFGIGFDHSFNSHWNIAANYAKTSFGGVGLGEFDQNLDSYDAHLNYYPAKNQRAFIELSHGRTNGYRADLQETFAVGYSYDILPGVALVGMYRIRSLTNFSIDTQNNGYRSAGFDLELQINFRR